MRSVGLALSFSGLLAITQVTSAYAAPLTSLSAAAKPLERASRMRSDVTEVRWRGGWGIGAGLLAGALIGSAFAAPYYYEPYPAYDGYVYSYGPAAYYYPGYAYRPYWGGYGWGGGPRFYTTYGYGAAPWGYTIRPHWRNSYDWQPRPWRRHHHGVIRVHHRW